MSWDLAGAYRVSGVVLAVLLAAVLLRDHPRDRSARASVVLLAGVAGHLITPLLLTAHAPLALVRAAVLLSLSVPFAFWLLAQVHFDDDFAPSHLHAAILLVVVGVGFTGWLIDVEPRLTIVMGRSAVSDFWAIAPRLLGVGLVVHALIRTYVGAGSDLVVSRLRLRYGVLVVAGTYILLVLMAEVFLRDSAATGVAEKVHSLLLLATLFAVGFLAFRVSPQLLRPPALEATAPAIDPKIVERLRSLMEVEEVFREEGLSIGVLADRVGTQEYKLRELINTQLGFKNFNAFLHHYRIRAAEKALADPAQAHLGIAEIAYEVGYRSLATFNKAFKEATRRTPKELRESR
jgi:AraC-like DNA-binding protein